VDPVAALLTSRNKWRALKDSLAEASNRTAPVLTLAYSGINLEGEFPCRAFNFSSCTIQGSEKWDTGGKAPVVRQFEYSGGDEGVGENAL
jgi:hypothetical protein